MPWPPLVLHPTWGSIARWREGPQRVGHRQPVQDSEGVGLDVGSQPHGHGQPSARPTKTVAGQVHGDTADPGLRDVVVPNARPTRRGPGQRLLDGVLCVMQVAGDQVELTGQATEDGVVELLEALVAQAAPSRPAAIAPYARWSGRRGSLRPGIQLPPDRRGDPAQVGDGADERAADGPEAVADRHLQVAVALGEQVQGEQPVADPPVWQHAVELAGEPRPDHVVGPPSRMGATSRSSSRGSYSPSASQKATADAPRRTAAARPARTAAPSPRLASVASTSAPVASSSWAGRNSTTGPGPAAGPRKGGAGRRRGKREAPVGDLASERGRARI
jgi:hypothetical protein